MLVLVVIQTVVLALLALLVVSLLRSHAAILRRLHEAGLGLDDDAGAGPAPVAAPVVRTRDGVPGPGSGAGAATDVVGTSPRGSALSIAVGGGATLLAFLTTGCTTCQAFWRELGRGLALPDGLRLVVVTKGDEAEDRAAVAALAPPSVTTVVSSAAWADYGVPASPYFVLVRDGRVAGEGAALGWDQVLGLLERALAGPAGGQGRRRRSGSRLEDTDAELLAAGIAPGDPSLYPGGHGEAR